MFAHARTTLRFRFLIGVSLAIASLSANATNHLVRINEIMTGYNGDSSIQFIEFVVSDAGQKAWGPISTVGSGPQRVGRSQIEFFDGSGNKTGRFVFPTNAPAGALTVLVATQEFATLTGIVPDFIIPKGMLQPNAGRVVYSGNPNSTGGFGVTLTVSYGGAAFTMPNDAGGAPNAATLSLIGGQSLTRTGVFSFDGITNGNANFVLGTPTPCSTRGPNSNNARTNVVGESGLPLVSTLAKAGENLFLKETFRGNGRTCATCHAPQHQFGMPPSFVASLPATDPLFVHELNVNTIVVNDNGSIIDPAGTNAFIAETNRAQPSDFVLGGTITDTSGNTAKVLSGTGNTYRIVGGQSLVINSTLTDSRNNKARLLSFTAGTLAGPTLTNGLPDGLESSQLLRGSGVPSGVARALVLENINGIDQPHVFRGSPTLVSIKHTAPYGLSGEFANLRDFSQGAIAQHFPLSMNRAAGVDFRIATNEELLALEEFQNSILTPADENFDEANLFDRFVTTEKQKRGRELFFGTAKCSACHGGKTLSHSDGQFATTLGVNENFNTGVADQFINLQDNLPSEHAIGGANNSREFNTPTLFNIRKTAPYFHDNSAATLRNAVEFYDSIAFNASPAHAQVGTIIEAADPVRVDEIVAFLEALTDLPFDYTRQVQFPLTFLGQTSSSTVTLVNTGTLPLTISNLVIRGDHPDEFGHLLFSPDGGPIQPGEQRTVQVLFSPIHSGVHTAIFEFEVSDGSETYEVGVAMRGEGALKPVIFGTVENQHMNDPDTLSLFSSVEISNTSPTDPLTITVAFDPDHGTLFGGGFTQQGGGVLTFVGTAEASTAAIQGLFFSPAINTFTPGTRQKTDFSITVDNGTVQTTDSSTSILVLSINDAPTIQSTVAGQQTTDAATIQPFAQTVVADIDRPDQPLAVRIFVDEPLLGTLSGDTLSQISQGVFELSGTASEVSQSLSQLDYTPANNIRAPGEQYSIAFAVEVTDGFAVVTDSQTTVTVTSVNDAPVLSGAHASANISDLSTFLPFGIAVVFDADVPAQTLDIHVLLDDPHKGTLDGFGFADFGSGVYGFTGSVAQANLALNSLEFTPTPNRVLPGQSETTTFTVVLNDSFGETFFTSAAAITTFSVNDQPLFSGVNTSQSTNDRDAFKLFQGVQVVDADAFGLPITLTVTQDWLARGLLEGENFTEVINTPAGRTLSFTGTLAQVNAALAALTFVPASNRMPVGSAEDSLFTLSVSDGELAFNTGQLTLKIISVNDAPTFTKGAHQIVLEDSGRKSVPKWASAISAGLGSEANQALTFLLTSENPALFSEQPAVSVDGTLTFTPAPDADGTALITAVLKDNGGTALGGSDSSAPQVFIITLVPVNELPQAGIFGASLTGIAGVPVAFSGTPSTDKDGTIENYAWNFGDGLAVDTTSGVAPFHRYTAAGTYTVTLTVTDNEGATSTVTKQIVIVGGDGGGPNGDADGDGIANQDDSDADGDGFSNDIEITANTNPYDGASLPFGAATPPEPLLLGKVLIGLDFANNGKDSIQLSGLLPVPENAVLNGAQVLLNVGGVAETFLINGKGQGRNAASSLTIQVKQKNGIIAAQNAKFSAKLSKGTYREQLKDEKLTATTAVTNAPRTILVALLVNTLGKHYQQVIDLSYTAKNGKGKAGTVKK